MKLEYTKLLVDHLDLLKNYISYLSSIEDMNEQEQEDLNDALFDYEFKLRFVKDNEDKRVQEHVNKCYREVTLPVRAKLDGLKMTSKILKQL